MSTLGWSVDVAASGAGPARRIVSLLPSATEIVYALGLEDRLVGVTHECDWPPEARAKPQVSNTSLALPEDASPLEIDGLVSASVTAGRPLYTLDERLIGELQPDLILAQDLCRVCAVPSGQVTEALEVLGCSAGVISLDPGSLDEIIDGIAAVGVAAGWPDRGRAVARSLRERVRAVATKAAGRPRPSVVVLEWSDPPFVGGHWVPEMVRIAGGTDRMGIEGEPSRRVSWSELEAASPEVVIYAPCGWGLGEAVAGARSLYGVPELAATPAAREGRVFAVDASSYFSRPGPRICDGLEILAWVLHPDGFEAPPPARVARVAAL
jgi:iron complex transport system substrate-binding protein